MNIQEAKTIITVYQKWRVGQPPYDSPAVPLEYTHAQITEAMDVLLAAVTVTDEMVERAYAALDYYSGFSPQVTKQTLKAALTAALGE
jgi:hypothetical protein